MKSFLLAFALVSFATAATLPDSATQGPNPQDIATPEPEYIDIDYPEAAAPAAKPAPAPAPAPAPQAFSAPAPRQIQYPVQTSYDAPIIQRIPQTQYAQPQFIQPQYTQAQYTQPQYTQQLSGHYYGQSGYQYRRPVYIRRFYRSRY